MLNVKKFIKTLLNDRPVGYGTPIDISTGHTSFATAYVCPADGIVVVNNNYRAGQYCIASVYDDSGNYLFQIEGASTQNYAMVGGQNISMPVFKGNNIVVTGTNLGSYTFAKFVPYKKLGGGY